MQLNLSCSLGHANNNLGYKCGYKLWSCVERMFIYNMHDIVLITYYI